MKKALFVRGGWTGHTPVESTDLFASLLESKGFSVEKSDTLEVYQDADRMNALSLVVQSVSLSDISSDQEKGLLNAIRGGVGFAGWHGGAIDSFRSNTEYQWMTGGQWVAHPGDIIPSHSVDIADPDHTIVQGLGGFTLPDTEQYYCHVDPANHVLCTTTISGKHGPSELYTAGTVMPYAWTKPYGSGRVFIAAWGHTYEVFDVPEAREIMLRGMLWASR
jgi:type 1 glutamine amidotransferase